MKKPLIAVLAVMLAAAAGAKTLLAAGRGRGPGLTDAEAAKVKSVFEESRKDAEPLRKDLKVALEKLRWQVDAKADSKDLASTLEQLDKSRKALAEQREKTLAKLKAALPVEAQAKLALFKAERRHRMMGMRRHGWGGMKAPGRDGRDHAGPPPADEEGE